MRGFSIIGLGMLLGACASSQDQIPMPAPIICTAGADCDGKWSRAAAWIDTNSALKIRVRTPTTIQTSDPPARSDRTPAFTVTRVARGDGRYEIAFNGGCANASRCVPTIAESRARFTAFVLGEEPPPQLPAKQN
jgi:hypothetical protein